MNKIPRSFHDRALPLAALLVVPLRIFVGVVLLFLVVDGVQAIQTFSSPALVFWRERDLGFVLRDLVLFVVSLLLLIVITGYANGNLARERNETRAKAIRFLRLLEDFFRDYDSVMADLGQVVAWGFSPKYTLYTNALAVEGGKPRSIKGAKASKFFYEAIGGDVDGIEIETDYHEDSWGNTVSATSRAEFSYTEGGKVFGVIISSRKDRRIEIDFYNKKDAKAFRDIFNSTVEEHEVMKPKMMMLKQELESGNLDNLCTKEGVTWAILKMKFSEIGFASSPEISDENWLRFVELEARANSPEVGKHRPEQG
jgi:hypothetical protein